MNFLAENPLPIWVGAAVLLTVAAVIYIQTRRAALAAMAAIVVIVAALIVVEQLRETPSEAVERTLYEMADVVESE